MSNKALEEARRLAAAVGINIDVDEVKSNKELAKDVQKQRDKDSMDLDIVLLSIEHHAHSTTIKECGWCGSKFMTNYCFRRFCSDECSIAQFREHYKIDPRRINTPASHWDYEPTLALDPLSTARLYEFAKRIVDQYETLGEEERDEAEALLASENEPPALPELDFSFADPLVPSEPEVPSALQEGSSDPVPASPQPEPDILGSLDFSF